MESVEVKSLSNKQLSKLRNGHPVRLQKGSGMTVLLSPDKMKKLERAFRKNKGVTLSLTAEEISGCGGCGLFAGGKINMKPLQNVLGVLKKAGENAGKPFEKTVKVNPFKLGYDLGHDVIAPELKKAPGIREAYGGKLKVPKGLSRFGEELGKDVAKQAAKEVVKEGVKSMMSGEGLRRRRLGKRLGNSHIKSVTKELGRAGKQILRDVILPEGKKALTQAIRQSVSSYGSEPFEADASYDMPVAEIMGSGLYAGMKGGTVTSTGISLLHSQFNPNVRSQPQFVNPVTSVGYW